MPICETETQTWTRRQEHRRLEEESEGRHCKAHLGSLETRTYMTSGTQEDMDQRKTQTLSDQNGNQR